MLETEKPFQLEASLGSAWDVIAAIMTPAGFSPYHVEGICKVVSSTPPYK